ncbi:MAG TPA: LLM class flavin-dependent oxidoreductase [Polyangiales bacterium]|nr:LLM class flavin-dependent oxidoreductase [Polyangiales bacterium]
MRFGMHQFLACPEGQAPHQRYREAIEQAVHAELLGFESVWPVEQHFDQRISALSCPTLLLAAIAERTRTLRLGTGIVQLPLSHPLRVAEEIATLDVLSVGRVELGVGRGGNPLHFAGFGVSVHEGRERLEEGLQLIRRAWTQDNCWFAGKYYDAKDLSLSPRPIQWPHPPIRVAANSVDTARWAGAAGYSILAATNINPLPRLRQLLGAYHEGRAANGHPQAQPDDISLLMPMHVAASDEQARNELAPSVARFATQAAGLTAKMAEKCADDEERKRLMHLVGHLRNLDVGMVQDNMGVIGSPETCRSRLQQIRVELNPGRVIGWFDFGGLVPHAQVLTSMQRFADYVLPYA